VNALVEAAPETVCTLVDVVMNQPVQQIKKKLLVKILVHIELVLGLLIVLLLLRLPFLLKRYSPLWTVASNTLFSTADDLWLLPACFCKSLSRYW
jgi:hypothetical protein